MPTPPHLAATGTRGGPAVTCCCRDGAGDTTWLPSAGIPPARPAWGQQGVEQGLGDKLKRGQQGVLVATMPKGLPGCPRGEILSPASAWRPRLGYTGSSLGLSSPGQTSGGYQDGAEDAAEGGFAQQTGPHRHGQLRKRGMQNDAGLFSGEHSDRARGRRRIARRSDGLRGISSRTASAAEQNQRGCALSIPGSAQPDEARSALP